jgi:hypothetical protein
MYVSAPQPRNDQLPLFFNVDTSVGQNGSNSSTEDILLVQLLLRKAAEPATALLRPDRKQRMLKVALTGMVDAATIDAIKAVQEDIKEFEPATVVDGKISPAKGYQYGGNHWTIIHLNSTVRRHFPSVWPRLHDFPNCPLLLKQKVAQVL